MMTLRRYPLAGGGVNISRSRSRHQRTDFHSNPSLTPGMYLRKGRSLADRRDCRLRAASTIDGSIRCITVVPVCGRSSRDASDNT